MKIMDFLKKNKTLIILIIIICIISCCLLTVKETFVDLKKKSGPFLFIKDGCPKCKKLVDKINKLKDKDPRMKSLKILNEKDVNNRVKKKYDINDYPIMIILNEGKKVMSMGYDKIYKQLDTSQKKK